MDRTQVDKSRLRRAIAPLLLVLVLAFGLSTAAAAGNLGQYFADGVYIRTGPHVSDTALGQGFYGQNICDYFTASGDSINGNPYWDYHQNLSTTVTGYSSWEYLGIYGPPPTSC